MPGESPLVSVALVTYNQARFVSDSIRSVLAQTVSDLEVVVVDDGSTDDTAAAAAAVDDPRVRLIRQENQGPGGAANTAIAACRGRFVAFMTGDDLCHPRRLEAQLAAFDRAGGGVIFSNVDYIDEDGRPCSGHYPADYFAIRPMTRGQIFERLFFESNFIHTCTTFLERSALLEAGRLDPLLYQLQDYDLLVKLIKRHAFTFLPDVLFSWRMRAAGGNLSNPNVYRSVRTINEQNIILRRYFDGATDEFFREAFAHRFVHVESRSPVELACEQAFHYMANNALPFSRAIGLERLHALLSDPAAAHVLAERFSFRAKDYVDRLLWTDVTNLAAHAKSIVTIDTGAGFDTGEKVTLPVNHGSERFDLTFDLSWLPKVQAIRWEPAAMQCGEVHVQEIFWVDRSGVVHSFDPGLIHEGSGQYLGPGRFRFETLFPMTWIPLAAEARSLTIRGTWKFDNPGTSAWFCELKRRELESALAEAVSNRTGSEKKPQFETSPLATAQTDYTGAKVERRFEELVPPQSPEMKVMALQQQITMMEQSKAVRLSQFLQRFKQSVLSLFRRVHTIMAVLWVGVA